MSIAQGAIYRSSLNDPRSVQTRRPAIAAGCYFTFVTCEAIATHWPPRF